MSKINELFEKVAKDRDDTAGFDIVIDEMKEYFKGMTASKEGELPDSELDKVAGGFVSGDTGVPFPGGLINFPGFIIIGDSINAREGDQ